ncbi:MAG: DMT family transporter [Promethearchaeota archaeon]
MVENKVEHHEDLKKGLLYGIIGTFLIGFQPIIANSRPVSLDPFIFAAMTCMVETAIFFPLMLNERRKLRLWGELNPSQNVELDSLLNGWKRHKKLLGYIGLNFGIAQILFFIAYEIAGSINGALAQKTTVIYGIIFGYLINNEFISKIQIIFSFVLFFGLTLAITQGSFNLLELNLGVVAMLIASAIWMLGHSATKPLFANKESTPIQIIFIRNALSGTFLIFVYLIFFPMENFGLFLEPVNIFYYILMGVDYGSGLYCWYKCLSNVNISKATVIVSPTPIVTAFFAIFLGEAFTIFHLMGMIIIIISIYVIVREKKR